MYNFPESLVVIVQILLLVVALISLFCGVRRTRSTRSQNRDIKKLRLSPTPDGTWRIKRGMRKVLVFINDASGGKLGGAAMRCFSSYLDASQCISLSAHSPDDVLRRVCQDDDADDSTLVIIACGGDGTVGWLIGSMMRRRLRAQLVAMPLGTGNDFAREFLWGGGCSEVPSSDVRERLVAVARGTNVRAVDVWRMHIESAGSEPPRDVYFNNYLSFGIDAEVTLKFHLDRKENPSRYSSQLLNKAQYLYHGVQTAMVGTPLQGAVDVVRGDGSVLPLNGQWKGVVMLNISSYQGGANFWGSGVDREDGDAEGPPLVLPSTSDGILEIVAIAGTVHIGCVHLSIDRSIRLAQEREVELHVHKPVAFQADGEPWMQQPSVMTIHRHGSVPVLVGPYE